MSGMRMVLVAVVVLLLQLELFADLPIFGVMPDLMLGLAVVAGLVGGAERGATVGFGAGLLYDVFLPTPLTLSAVSYALVGCAMGILAENFADNAVARSVSFFLALLGVAAGFLTFVLLGELLGQDNLWNSALNRIVLVGSVYTVCIITLLQPFVRWGLGEVRPDHTRPLRPSRVMN